jgi:NAD(P)-dependent dehydrogenase (short-subunit alcohol dehydrogenase family)
MKTVMITGANRGIGLGLTKHYANQGWEVIATYRDKPMELSSLGSVKTVQMDVSSSNSIQAGFEKVKSMCNSVDLLINNAGRYGNDAKSLEETIDIEDLVLSFRTNSIGALLVTQAALPLLERGKDKKIIHISSKMGSITDNSSGASYGYRASKTALNMFNKNLAVELKNKGMISVVMHPGWVQTDMGGKNALVTIDDSVVDLAKTIHKFTMEHSGGFFERTGEKIPF